MLTDDPRTRQVVSFLIIVVVFAVVILLAVQQVFDAQRLVNGG